LLWGLGFFVAGQLAFFATKEHGWPWLCEPQQGRRLTGLRARLAEAPDRPLVLFLGSSRVAMGLRPDVLETCKPGARRRAVVFNFGLAGAGPLQELVCLRELLTAGIRPDWILLEIWPPLMTEGYRLYQARMLERTVYSLRQRDLGEHCRYYPECLKLRRRWWKAQVVPTFSHRFTLMNRFASSWRPQELRLDQIYRHIDGWGWLRVRGYHSHPDPESFRVALAGHRALLGSFLQPFRLSPHADHSQHELLELCQRNGIPVTLLFMPEAPTMRDWYSPAVLADVDDYFRRLSDEFRIPVLDARHWMADEAFCDSHHLVPAGAAAFSRRLENEILQPYLAGQPGPYWPPLTDAGVRKEPCGDIPHERERLR
jgi:hypothetical protein